jgi:hypothetical protein
LNTTRTAVFLSLCLLAAACRAGAKSIEDDPGPPPAQLVSGAYGAAEELVVQRVEHSGVVGGRIVYTLAGTPDEVHAALHDWENMAGHRAWARSFEVLADRDGVSRTRWVFRWGLAMSPEVVVAQETLRTEDELVVRYRLEAGVMELSAFFGDYRIRPDAVPGRSLMVQRAYTDGAFGGIDGDALRDGLREDARLLREWMDERTEVVAGGG